MSSMKSNKVILLTGASSGIGYDTAVALAQQGHKVYAAARRVERMEPLRQYGIVPLKMDVTDEASMKEGVKTLLDAEGRIDVLINNAGYGYFGAVENVPMDDARNQLEVNVFGLARLCQLVLPTMRAQHSGRIINTASVAGRSVFFGIMCPSMPWSRLAMRCAWNSSRLASMWSSSNRGLSKPIGASLPPITSLSPRKEQPMNRQER